MNIDTRKPRYAVTVIAAIITVLLQIIIAPNIAINGVVPDFILVFVVVTAISHDTVPSMIVAFILGLVYDFTCSGPIGLMALVLTIIAFAVSSLDKELFSGPWFIEVITLLIASFFGELLYAVVMAIMGLENDFLSSFVYITLPNTVYDALFGLIIFPILAAINKRTSKGITNLKRRLH
jgi:rod shape-determining protein MreD